MLNEPDPSNHQYDQFTYGIDSQKTDVHIKTRVCCGAETLEAHSGGAISAIVTASVLVVAIGGFSLFRFVIKKKSWAELLKLLVG